MCVRHPDRDEKGRLRPGNTANPRGRRPLSAVARLVEMAEAAGATVTITVPPRAAPRPRLRGHRPSDDLPPRAA
jgi:hypothetical protein